MTNEKRQYITRLQGLITGLASLVHVLEDAEAVYQARLYAPTMINELTPEELTEFGMDQNDLQLAIFLCHNMVEFLNGRTITPNSYITILNDLRTDI